MKAVFSVYTAESENPFYRECHFYNTSIRYVVGVISKLFKMRNIFCRVRIHRYHILGVAILCIQCIVLTCLLYSFLPSSTTSHSALLEDAHEASEIFSSFGTPIFVVGKELLQKGGATRVGWTDKAPFAVLYDNYQPISLLYNKLQEAGFKTVEFVNIKTTGFSEFDDYSHTTIPIGIALQKKYPFYISFVHSRSDHFWWRGGVMKDILVEQKLSDSGLSEKDLVTVSKEGIYETTELVKGTLGGYPMLLPYSVKMWINSWDSDYEFIECDYQRAHRFLKEQNRKVSDTSRFQHKAWKALSRAQVVMNILKIPFWLSSGTCLGYYRECGIIPYTTDVDIGIFAKDYSENIIKELVFRDFRLKHIFGRLNDSYELSFVSAGVKLDIFFFYEEGKTVWNGGTQMKTGKKFKYTFPRFDLCWTEFLYLLVRVPCNTTSYILANYGPDWRVPKMKWDWHKSPPNVVENGYWPRDQHQEVMQEFDI